VIEHPPAIVGGLGTYTEYMTKEFVALGWAVSVYTLNPGNLKKGKILPLEPRIFLAPIFVILDNSSP